METNKYIVLFYTQYGAIHYSRLLKKEAIENITKPVPRELSSSCGICVEAEIAGDIMRYLTEDVEAIYQIADREYIPIYRSE